MVNNVMIAVIAIAAVASASIGYVAQTHLKSTKREFFVLGNFCVAIYCTGYMLELTAQTADGGLIATKVMYLGTFASVMFMRFVQEYCEIRLWRAVNALIFAAVAAINALVLTSEHHTLFYASYWYDNVSPIHELAVTGGIMYPVGILVHVLCAVISVAVIIVKIRASAPEKRTRLAAFAVYSLVPSAVCVLRVFNVNTYGVNLAPILILISTTGLYFGLIRYDLLDNEETIRSQTWFKEMVANISHDLKTPLAVMSLNLETLSQLTAAKDDAKYQRCVRAAYQKNLDLQRLIQNLLEASRIETGRTVYAVKPLSLLTMLAQVRDRYDTYLEDKGIFFDIAAGEDMSVGADHAKIWSVFDNIIYNAARHTEAGGSVTVTAAGAGSAATVTITDTGSGITPEHLPRVFERFYKGSQARDGNEGESGLGLYIVKSVMEGCGGSVSAESEVGRGTSIILTFSAMTS